MSKILKERWQRLAGIISEGEVVSFGDFKNKKQREEYENEVLITKNGETTLKPSDWLYVKINHQDQAEAIVNGDMEEAEKLGAKFYEVVPGDEVESNAMQEDKSLSERSSMEFVQDVTAYISNIGKNRCCCATKSKKEKQAIGTVDVVDGPYTQVSKNQPFEDDKHREEFLNKLDIDFNE